VVQIDRLRDVISGFVSGELFSTRDIEDETGFPRPSIRRLTGNLVKTGEIERVEPGLFKRGDIEDGWHRKFIGTQKYGGSNRQFFALTFEQNDTDREAELLGALDDFLNNTGFVESAGDTGYSDQIVEAPDTNYIYDSIQVGQL